MNLEPIRSLLRAIAKRFGAVAIVAAVIVAFVLGWAISGGGAERPAAAAHDHEPAGETRYTCSMHPDVRLPDPDDKCPICFMELIPVRSSGGGGAQLGPREIELSPEAAALIAVETAPVTRRWIEHPVRMVGQIDYDETRLAYITAYMPGRLDRLYVDYTGIPVQEGDHLAEIYSPRLLVAQQELLQAHRSLQRLPDDASPPARQAAEAVLDAARERLRLLGVNQRQIETVLEEGVAGDHVTLYSPIGGVVTQKYTRQGSYVREGDRIYAIADLSEVWVVLEAYESDLPWLRYGQNVRFQVEGLGGEAFEGRMVFIDPVLDPQTRTVRVRVNVENPERKLRPGMFVRATAKAQVAASGKVIAPELAGKWISPMHPEVVRDEPGDCPVCGMALEPAESLDFVNVATTQGEPPLVVPDSAVLRTGRRAVVYVRTQADPQPRFEGREVELGPRGEGFFIVRSGLDEGEQVVTRGNFQIDSALQIEAKTSMMGGRPAEPEATADATLEGAAAEPVQALVSAYLTLWATLADDDLPASRAAAERVAAAADAMNDATWPLPFARLWQPHALPVESAADALAEAQDIEAIRTAFKPISDALISVLSDSHVQGLDTLYRAHCPMAFGFTGASWLTPEKTILNPYFGDAMLRCGTIEETLHE